MTNNQSIYMGFLNLWEPIIEGDRVSEIKVNKEVRLFSDREKAEQWLKEYGDYLKEKYPSLDYEMEISEMTVDASVYFHDCSYVMYP